ncbi:NADH-flavin reductase [Amycolatopsis antarctica]|uniref:NADH-flavin reductase n=1 Tax=Amycolatopsis antarctica TaxID=1854586 RepID=A0A263D7C9_9PSEU|nr:NAD(P)H-binding protein [Amycolatopsis antarctica]OZM73315.1 NADH-flavin reductase [Amycolatopsis antarctica]
MRLTVFGGTGRTGKPLLEKALSDGHEVTAVVRDPSRLDPGVRDRVEVVLADIRDAAAIAPAVDGRDAVLSALGPAASGPSTVCADFARAAVAALAETGVSRLVVLSASGAHTDGDPPFVRLVVKPLLGRVLRHAFADMRAMEAEVMASALDWTVVRPPRLLDRPETGTVRSRLDGNVRGGSTIARADLARYLLDALGAEELHRQAVSVAG